MIRLTRNRPAAPASLAGAKRIERATDLVGMAAAGSFSFNAKIWGAKPVKNALRAESHSKCAYCESPTATVAHGDVEHMRPKDLYWWLAYCFDNYAFSCQPCNQTFKGAKFPVARRWAAPRVPAGAAARATLAAALMPDARDVTAGMTFAAYAKKCRAEQPRLPDPYLADVEPLLAWQADDTLKEVRAIARGSAASRRALAAAEACLGINREELLKWRHKHYSAVRRIATALPALPAALRADAEAGLQELMADDAQYAGMVRYFVRVVWQIPGL